MRYKVSLVESEEGFSASVPGLPGCCSQGATRADTLENIRGAIEQYLAVAEELSWVDGAAACEAEVGA